MFHILFFLLRVINSNLTCLKRSPRYPPHKFFPPKTMPSKFTVTLFLWLLRPNLEVILHSFLFSYTVYSLSINPVDSILKIYTEAHHFSLFPLLPPWSKPLSFFIWIMAINSNCLSPCWSDKRKSILKYKSDYVIPTFETL